MLQNRTWIDPTAEAEFWGHMERLETLQARLAAAGRWEGLLNGDRLRRAAFRRDLEVIQGLAQDLVDRHTVLAAEAPGTVPERPSASDQGEGADPLRALAGMVVSLRQDRVARPAAGEEKMV